MNRVLSIAAVVAIAAFAFACGGKKETSAPADSTATAAITEEVVNYTADTVASVGYVAYANKTEKLPIVLVVPEWWGRYRLYQEPCKATGRSLATWRLP